MKQCPRSDKPRGIDIRYRIGLVIVADMQGLAELRK